MYKYLKRTCRPPDRTLDKQAYLLDKEIRIHTRNPVGSLKNNCIHLLQQI